MALGSGDGAAIDRPTKVVAAMIAKVDIDLMMNLFIYSFGRGPSRYD